MPEEKTPEENIEISVVVPVYNSAPTLSELTERLEKVLRDLVGKSYEIVFVNDGSADSSWDLLKKMASTNEKIVAVNLTRNFGQHNALMCGFPYAQGEFIITLDDDLQNPPEEIPKLFKEIHSGYDVVYGVYRAKQHSRFRNLGSAFVQFIYRRTFNIDVRLTSFRIMKRDIVCHILSYEKSFTFIDGLICWFTKNIGTAEIEHHKRTVGNTGYSLNKLIMLALNMMTNFSILPLQVSSLVGLIFALIGFLFGTYFLCVKVFFDIPVSGFASTIVSITIFSGVQLLSIGLIGEYIGRIHINVSKRPQYAIRDIVAKGNRKCINNTK